MLDNLIDEINISTNDSNMSVLNAIYDAYDKAYTIVENYEGSEMESFSIFQESDTSEIKKGDTKKRNILSAMIHAIANFFKMIGNAIKNLFTKKSDNATDRLKKVDELDDETAEKVQVIIEDPSSSVNKKCKEIGKKHKDFSDKNIDDSYVEEKGKKDKESDEDDSTVINVKSKKIWTRIIFDNWKRFLEQSDKYIDSVVGEVQEFGGWFNNAISNRPTRQMKWRSTRVLNMPRSEISFLHPKSIKNKRYHLFKLYPHRVTIKEIVDNVNDMRDMFKQVAEKAVKAGDSFEHMCKITQEKNESPTYTKYDRKVETLNKDLHMIRDEFNLLYEIITRMTSYMSAELKMYGSLMDILEPIIKESKKVKVPDENHVVVHMATGEA